jgi:DNA helicase-2/ATP-dependent DNA helicase PcrA
LIDVSHLLDDLTSEQREAVTHIDGPLLIIAGAGSGKTRVLTRRVAYLVSQGVDPASILAITFTNKAAGEMKQRISTVLGRQVRDFGQLIQHSSMICTFHSLCLRILRHFGQSIGLPTNFTIYDSGDQNKLIKEALKTLELSSTHFSPGTMHSAISNAKNKLLNAEAFAQHAGDFFSKNVSRVYTKYSQLLKSHNALDFDDLLLLTAEAFRDHPHVLAELQNRFAYVLIDEYQDTNHAQYMIAHALAQRSRNICVVGDPDQSIYAWRGADLRNILDFEEDYPDAKVVRLEQNYRSTQNILHVASELISRNRLRKDKRLWTENAVGEKTVLLVCQDDRDEARAITEEFRKLHDNHGYDWNKMAIFYRMNSLSRVMEDALRNANIPYVMARGVEFYNRKEIKDTLAYLRVIVNPQDDISLERIVNVPPRGIGASSVKQMQAWGIAHGVGLFAAMEQASQVPSLSTRAIKSVGQFVSLIHSWRAMITKSAAPDSLLGVKGPVQSIMEDVIRRSGMEAMLRKDKIGEETGESGMDNLNALITSAAEYDSGNPEASLAEYLHMVSLVSDTDHLQGSGGAITMMTLHAAKGLEFPVVAILGLEEGILPHSRARTNPAELEEERRLCFVGITRAQERLILSRAAFRTIRGLRERSIMSPFCLEMPAEAIQTIDRTDLPSSSSYQTTPLDADSTSDRMSRFRPGQLVRHATFGLGRIADINHTGARTVALVDFNSTGRKKLVLEVAPLEPVAR